MRRLLALVLLAGLGLFHLVRGGPEDVVPSVAPRVDGGRSTQGQGPTVAVPDRRRVVGMSTPPVSRTEPEALAGEEFYGPASSLPESFLVVSLLAPGGLVPERLLVRVGRTGGSVDRGIRLGSRSLSIDEPTRFEDLPLGVPLVVQLWGTGPDHSRLVVEEWIAPFSKGERRQVELVLPHAAMGEVSGRVLDSTGAPVSFARVELIDEDAALGWGGAWPPPLGLDASRTTASSDGTFRFVLFREDPVRLVARSPRGVQLEPVLGRRGDPPVTLELAEGGWIEGRAVASDALRTALVQDFGWRPERPVQTLVSATDQDGNVWTRTHSDRDGTYRLEALPVGLYTVVASRAADPGGSAFLEPTWRVSGGPVAVRPGDPGRVDLLLELELPRDPSWDGR